MFADYQVSTEKIQMDSGVAENVREGTELLKNRILMLEEVEKQ